MARENLRKVLVTMALASLNPNREWSVNTVGRLSKVPTMRASWANLQNAEWPWTRSTFSFTRMCL